MGTNTSGAALIADGTNYNPVVVSGDISIGTDGTAAISSGVIVNADINGSAAIADSKLDTISTANKVGLAALDIDGGTELGEAIVDADLLIIDNGAGGTNRKVLASRIKSYASGSAAVTALNNATANELVTVGATTTELDAEAKLLFDPPTLTIGNATAEDTKIVFDGAEQDYHLGLDDSNNSFTIGLGSALGTTSHIVSSPSGEVTMPLQPLFLVRSPGASNATGGGTQYSVVASNSIYDIGSNFSSATFTAPVTGKYLLGGSIYVSGLTASMDSCSFGVVTSNYTAGYWFYFGNIGAMRDNNNAVLINGSILADMDASDTAVWKIQINSGSDVADIGASDTNLFGALVA